MENVNISELKNRLPFKYKYAETVVERARENGISLTTKEVYFTVAGRSKANEPIVRRILEILIEESENKLASIV